MGASKSLQTTSEHDFEDLAERTGCEYDTLLLFPSATALLCKVIAVTTCWIVLETNLLLSAFRLAHIVSVTMRNRPTWSSPFSTQYQRQSRALIQDKSYLYWLKELVLWLVQRESQMVVSSFGNQWKKFIINRITMINGLVSVCLLSRVKL